MLVSALSRLAALRRAHDKPLLHEIGLVHVFDGVGVFRKRRRERGEAHRAPAELHGKKLQNAIVDRVEPQVVHFEEAERLRGNVLVDNTVAPHLCPVAHALEHAVRQTRSSAATAGNLERAVLADGNIKDGSRAHNNRREFLGRVILQAECNAEAVAQRTCEQARSRRRTDEREVGQIDPKKNADQDTTLYAQWEKNADSAPTNSTIPRTGDNQMALLASLCFSAAALIAVGIALTAYRKRKHA